jgi:low affinity Fe/Cu permease
MTLSIRPALTQLGTWAAHPVAFGIVLFYALLWLVFERHTFDWHAVATLATWLMTLVIQRAEHRDTQALHAKLDELIRANGEADNAIAGLDHDEPEEIERHRRTQDVGQT